MCFGLAAAGIEHIQGTPLKRTATSAEEASRYPWSHGLLMSGVWSAAVAAVAARVYRDRRTAGVIGLLVFTTGGWISSRTLPTCRCCLTARRRSGLDLEYSLDGDVHWLQALAAEVGLLAAGIIIYRRGRP